MTECLRQQFSAARDAGLAQRSFFLDFGECSRRASHNPSFQACGHESRIGAPDFFHADSDVGFRMPDGQISGNLSPPPLSRGGNYVQVSSGVGKNEPPHNVSPVSSGDDNDEIPLPPEPTVILTCAI